MAQERFSAPVRASVVAAVAALGVFHAAPVCAQFSYSDISLSAEASSTVNGSYEAVVSQPITTVGVFNGASRSSQSSPSSFSAEIHSDIAADGFSLSAGAGAGVTTPIGNTVTSGGSSSAGGSLTFSLSQGTAVSLNLFAFGGRSFGAPGAVTAARATGSASASLTGMGVNESLVWTGAPPVGGSKDLYLAAGTYTVRLLATAGLPDTSLPGSENLSDLARVSVRAVPEPASWALMALGFTGLAAVARRRPVSQG
jgi:hypothetical protein